MPTHQIIDEVRGDIAFSPGSHIALLTSDPMACLSLRNLSLEVRDTILVVGPKTTQFAFLCRVPLEGTVAENVLRYGAGGLWIDGCRISTGQEKLAISRSDPFHKKDGSQLWNPTSSGVVEREQHPQGRWPTNLVLIHGAECKLAGTKKVRTGMAFEPKAGKSRPHNVYGDSQYKGRVIGYADADGLETVTAWNCQEGCPVAALDQQSGILKSGQLNAGHGAGNNFGIGNADKRPRKVEGNYGGDVGGASRFYPNFTSVEAFKAWLESLLGGPRTL